MYSRGPITRIVCRATTAVPIAPFDFRTEVFEDGGVRGSEFLRRAKGAALRRGLTYHWVPERGVGSHGTLYFGKRFTVVKDLKKEIGPGLLAAMCKQLGIRKEDL